MPRKKKTTPAAAQESAVAVAEPDEAEAGAAVIEVPEVAEAPPPAAEEARPDGEAIPGTDEHAKAVLSAPDTGPTIEMPPPVAYLEEHELMDRIREQKDKVRELQGRYDTEKKEALSTKKEMDLAQEKLLKLIEQSEDDAPLFDQLKNGQSLDEDQTWKEAKCAEVFAGLTRGLVEKLHAAELWTLGQLTSYLESHTLTDIPGIGEAQAAKIEEALNNFWERRRQASEPLARAEPLTGNAPPAAASAQASAEPDDGDWPESVTKLPGDDE